MRETPLNKLIELIKNKRKESDISNTLLRFCQVEAEKLLQEEKDIITEAYCQGRIDEETRFPYAIDGEDYYKIEFSNDTQKAE